MKRERESEREKTVEKIPAVLDSRGTDVWCRILMGVWGLWGTRGIFSTVPTRVAMEGYFLYGSHSCCSWGGGAMHTFKASSEGGENLLNYSF